MCYSTKSSLIAWIISVGIGCYLWYRNRRYDRWNASFIWTFSAVQLWEAGIWSSSDSNQQELFVKLIALTLLAQPLVQTFAAWKTTGSKFLQIMVFVYIAVWLYTLYRVLTNNFSVTIGPHGHLVWETDKGNVLTGTIPIIGILYMIGMFLGLLWALPNSIPLIAVGILTLLWSMSRVSTGEIGSYWCYSAVAYSVVALFV